MDEEPATDPEYEFEWEERFHDPWDMSHKEMQGCMRLVWIFGAALAATVIAGFATGRLR